MSSKIKVDTIENVAGSGNVSLGSGHNLVVPGNNTTSGNATVGGTFGVTGAATLTGGVLTNTLNTASGTTITIPTGKTLKSTNTPIIGSGNVVQSAFDYAKTYSTNVSWTYAAGNSASYGSNQGNRTYVQASKIDITPKTTSSRLVCIGTVGWSNMSGIATGAHGVVITLDDTSLIDLEDFPNYPSNSGSWSAGYWPASHSMGVFQLSDGNQHSIRLRPFGYAEGGNSGTARYRGYSLTVLEVAG